MSISHHPDLAWLLDFAAGNLSRGTELVLSAHLTVCAECRAEVARAESFGARLLADAAPAAPKLSARDVLLAAKQGASASAGVTRSRGRVRDLEGFVSTWLECSLGGLAWRWGGPGLRMANLSRSDGERIWLLHAKPGTVLPRHTHQGAELTLVLKGGYFSRSEIYSPGDVEDADEETLHQPVITTGGECLCLAVTEGPLKFSGLVPRLVQRLIKI
ncbi:MAG: cupin domain-containing protein [Gammaproteobacteria bacterium]|nr:cupin domain-containing protein [Gammaproteobacteria bacterium]